MHVIETITDLQGNVIWQETIEDVEEIGPDWAQQLIDDVISIHGKEVRITFAFTE